MLWILRMPLGAPTDCLCKIAGVLSSQRINFDNTKHARQATTHAHTAYLLHPPSLLLPQALSVASVVLAASCCVLLPLQWYQYTADLRYANGRSSGPSYPFLPPIATTPQFVPHC
ncbi:hypothetical protein K504DRAFT_229462 [Pleomassaria siparia CBS 279.74]|uniref:Uncharacterized protein n=1 Tax=Pleomassaria siparia CBS 279.74 TaxID=1314801 RepID=A0A6G1KGN3_9PLEO|nr:hypothetical protein K504DRAFT_229462 [Pleomassaria siparia CBS 279.74]